MYTNHLVHTHPRYQAPFGCPAYVLEDQLQRQQPFDKWKERAKVDIYLGQSPIHSKDVALIMNPDTGYVSPKLHYKLDKRFDTVPHLRNKYQWTHKTGFVIGDISKRKLPDDKHHTQPTKWQKTDVNKTSQRTTILASLQAQSTHNTTSNRKQHGVRGRIQ